MKEYLEKSSKILDELQTTEQGLSEAEAARRLSEHGPNRLAAGKKKSNLQRFFEELKDPMILILLAAALISGITSAYEGESYADVVIILTVVIINAVLGVLQESKAEKAIEALQEIAAATSKVMRGGKMEVKKSEELVPGDIVILEAGDAVPADGRILESASMKIEEAALTGESVPVNKTADVLNAGAASEVPLGDRKNMVYMGSTVVYGRGRAVITGTGMKTEMGKIAHVLTQSADESTPLQKRLNQLSKILSVMVLAICAVIFVVGILKEGVTPQNILNTFMVAVSLAVAAIPEGLAAVVTIVLSIGVTKMSKRNAVIRKLTAVETLGCTQVICSDKTGTLTQNKMTVVKHEGSDIKRLVSVMALCSDAEPDENGEAVGEPTECALVNDAQKEGCPKKSLSVQYPRVGEAPFDSMRKRMTTIHRANDGTYFSCTKGAPDEILKRCTSVWRDGRKQPMTEAFRQEILSQNKAMADQALRVLAAAGRAWNQMPSSQEPDFLEQDLCFLGLCGMIDPVRPEVVDAIRECRGAGIRPVMITGDHKDTAVAIAKKLGILEAGRKAVTGAEIDQLSDEELDRRIEEYAVYARVQPEHKVRIVDAWKRKGRITAMTGDGVNDAPSIKRADIGIGMGITGTDVTKNVADMVLADDNFATIIVAVEEGRRIYDNIRKAIQFLLASNLAEVLSIFCATLMGFTILNPVHLLWINLITDSLPALALGVDKNDGKKLMGRPPRTASESLLANGGLSVICFYGALIAGISLTAFFTVPYMLMKQERADFSVAVLAAFLEQKKVLKRAQTYAFTVLGMSQLFHAVGMRDVRQSIFSRRPFENRLMLVAGGIGFLLQAAVTELPFLTGVFETLRLSVGEWLYLAGLSCFPLLAHELFVLLEKNGTQKPMEKFGRDAYESDRDHERAA